MGVYLTNGSMRQRNLVETNSTVDRKVRLFQGIYIIPWNNRTRSLYTLGLFNYGIIKNNDSIKLRIVAHSQQMVHYSDKTQVVQYTCMPRETW